MDIMRLILFIHIFIFIILVINSITTHAAESTLNWNKAEENIRHFRTFEDILEKSNVSHVGVQGRYISGSGQFSGLNISQLADKVAQVTAGAVDKIIILDTRLESHGFINDLPVEWKVKNDDANVGKTTFEILNDERNKLLEIFLSKMVNDVVINKVSTEEELVVTKGFEYVRYPTLDHSRPSEDNVEAFLELIKNNPNAWLHVHCKVGKGRTTTFMVMYDMFYNAKDVEFDEILDRQKEIDGEDLKKYLEKTDLDQRKWTLYNERLEFLKLFYRYCKLSDPHNITWQAWLQQQNSI